MTYAAAYSALIDARPDHPLRRLLATESAGNRLIVDMELRKIGSVNVAPAPIGAVDAVSEPENEAPDDPSDQVLGRLRRQQSDLFGERRRLSNTFHGCDTDAERAAVSRDIQRVQRQIEAVRRQIDDYKQHGRIPGQQEKYPIPDDPAALVLLRNSLRSSISRKSKEIRALGESGDESDRLQRAEAKMNELRNHLERVEKAIQDRDIQPRGLSEG